MKIEVRIAHPKGRSIELRYYDLETDKRVRINSRTKDPVEAERLREELEAQLTLGMKPSIRRNGKKTMVGPQMRWDDFVDEYYTSRRASGVQEGSAGHAISRLNIAAKILKPRTLADIATTAKLRHPDLGGN